jgi:hypothetical protein
MIKSLLTIPALLIAGAAFVIMYPILGVTLWVSFLVAGGSALAYASAVGAVAASGAPAERHPDRVRMNPVVDVALLRGRYFLTLAIAAGAGFLVVETFAFAQSTAVVIGFALGIALTVASVGLLLMHRSRPGKQLIGLPWRGLRVAVWDGIATLGTTLGIWQIVQSLVFGGATSRWLSFADGCAMLALAVVGLVLHELSTERVVHSLEVIDSRSHDGSTTDTDRERVAAHA